MKQRKLDAKDFWNTLNQKTDLLPGLPILEIAGPNRILIENHRGVIAYSPCQVTVRVQFGTYNIYGCNLRIAKMGKDQLVIQGNIDNVQLSRRC